VTNASEAQGKAAALALAKEGARVLIHDPSSAANVDPLVKAIVSSGGIAKSTTADAATADGSRQLAQEVRAVIGDRLDILVIDLTAVDPAAPLLLVELLLPILNAGSSVITLQPRAPAGKFARALQQSARQLRARGIRIDIIETESSGDTSRIGASILCLATQHSDGMTGAPINSARREQRS
jgi:NAD(P)-dependent dehydrogenase (short-subunit alcohol dehydrogenase family)